MNSKNNFFILIFFLLFFISVSFIILDISNFSKRHWTSFFDHELTLSYNSLLFNSGIKHEYVDHSGYFTILFLSFFYKILDILNYVNISNFNEFREVNNIDNVLQELIVYARIFAAGSVSFFLFLVFCTFNYFTKNKIFSFMLLLLVISSLGSIIHIIQLRTELIAMIFLLLSFLSLRFSFDKQNFSYFIFFLIFFYCSVLNKSQVFLYLPGILFLAKSNTKSLWKLNLENFRFITNKNLKFLIIFIIFFYLILKFYSSSQKNILSPIFIILTFSFINTFFYYYLKKYNLRIEENLIAINLCIILSYLLFKNILFIHPSTNEMAFINSFTNLIGNSKYISTDINLIKYIELNSYQIILVIFSVIINFIFKNKLSKDQIIFNLNCILIFSFISLIHLMRPNLYYFIFSDFFLILSFCNFSKFFNLKKIFIYLPILVILIYPQFNVIQEYLNSIKINQTKVLCKDTYFYDWHKKIKRDKFINFCEQNLN